MCRWAVLPMARARGLHMVATLTGCFTGFTRRHAAVALTRVSILAMPGVPTEGGQDDSPPANPFTGSTLSQAENNEPASFGREAHRARAWNAGARPVAPVDDAGTRRQFSPAALHPMAAHAEGPSLSADDEQWVQAAAGTLCSELANSTDEIDDCSNPDQLKQSLRDCLLYVYPSLSVDAPTAHDLCRASIRKSAGDVTERPAKFSPPNVSSQVDIEVNKLRDAGAGDEVLAPFGPGPLTACLIKAALAGSVQGAYCPDAYGLVYTSMIDTAAGAFDNDLLAQGLSANAVLDADESFRECMKDGLSSFFKSGSSPSQAISDCGGQSSILPVAPSPAAPANRVLYPLTGAGGAGGQLHWQRQRVYGRPHLAMVGASRQPERRH